MAEGSVTNPAGLFVSAVRRGFTANEAKRTAREREKERFEEVQLTSRVYQPVVDLRSAEMSIDQALMQGDRGFAQAKLQALWDAGTNCQDIEDLLRLRSDWNFQCSNDAGVQDGRQT
jgi:2-hydroxychromene-2-carboxylate isomerase